MTNVPDEGEVADLASDYTVLGELGRGGSAIVYRARDRALMRDVAIKVVRPRFAANAQEALERLEREARTVARLTHPNIVTVHAVKRLADGGLALVMQLVPGRTLKQAVQDDGAFDAERAERVLKDVAQALAFAHANGVVHRDVKPENVFLDDVTGRAMLSDFGIAYSQDEARLTMPGAAIGTPAYMAPEQIDGAPANARSDLYSLGVLAWEMLTGHKPWDGDALYNVIYKQKHEDLPAIDALRPGEVPPRLQYIVERMLQKKPTARWAGADGVLAALTNWVVPGDWRQWEESHRRRREREKTNPVKLAARSAGGEDATVRFERPPVGWNPDAASMVAAHAANETGSDGVPTMSGEHAAPPVVDDAADEAPSWAELPVEPERSSGSRRGALMIGTLVLLLAGGAFGLYAARIGPFARFGPSVFTRDDAAQTLAVLPPGTATPNDTGSPRDSLHDSANATGIVMRGSGMTAFGAPLPGVLPPREADLAALRDAAQRDSLVLATRRADSLRTDSLTAALMAARRSIAQLIASRSNDGTARTTEDAAVVAAGERHACAALAGGTACWGGNDRGQLGVGDATTHDRATMMKTDAAFTSLTSGFAHSCALTASGEAWCWGAGDRGQLGDGTFTARPRAMPVATSLRFRKLRAGMAHTCGIATDERLYCWGNNAHGQLGDGATANRPLPVAVRGGLRFIAIAAGDDHTCGITREGIGYCWGANDSGQLGVGSSTESRVPVTLNTPTHFTAIAAGAGHTCAISEAGEPWCWGNNGYGQAGGVGEEEANSPTLLQTPARFASIAAGTAHSCARTTSGQVWCWGRNQRGQAGGADGARVPPSVVADLPRVSALSVAGAHSCARTAAGDVYCWGANDYGQLGDGGRTASPKPVRVTAALVSPSP